MPLDRPERAGGRAPAQVYATLLDEGTYLWAERTMFRILAADDEVRERRAQRRHPVYAAPELLATASNQLWSWDIMKLKGPAKWTWYCLCLPLDVFSRYVVGWLVAPRESAALVERLIATSCALQRIGENPATASALNPGLGTRHSELVAPAGSALVAQPGRASEQCLLRDNPLRRHLRGDTRLASATDPRQRL